MKSSMITKLIAKQISLKLNQCKWHKVMYNCQVMQFESW